MGRTDLSEHRCRDHISQQSQFGPEGPGSMGDMNGREKGHRRTRGGKQQIEPVLGNLLIYVYYIRSQSSKQRACASLLPAVEDGTQEPRWPIVGISQVQAMNFGAPLYLINQLIHPGIAAAKQVNLLT
jgi:hypothetical protein